MGDRFETIGDLGKFVWFFLAAQRFGIVRKGLDSKDALAFAIYLDGQFAKMDFENRQIIGEPTK